MSFTRDPRKLSQLCWQRFHGTRNRQFSSADFQGGERAQPPIISSLFHSHWPLTVYICCKLQVCAYLQGLMKDIMRCLYSPHQQDHAMGSGSELRALECGLHIGIPHERGSPGFCGNPAQHPPTHTHNTHTSPPPSYPCIRVFQPWAPSWSWAKDSSWMKMKNQQIQLSQFTLK